MVSNADDAGPGSLRQAVLDACQEGVIRFVDRFAIQLQSEIVVGSTVVIDGRQETGGEDELVQILGGAEHRIFDVTATGDLTLSRVRVSNGTVSGSIGTNDQGGAVRNAGRLTLLDSRFDGNSSTNDIGLGGGAIFNQPKATLVVDGSLFDGNQALRGSAVFNSGMAEMRNCTFTGNVGTTNEGAIQNRGTLLGVHITVANNGGANAGFGGLFAFNADTTLINSVIADNVGNNNCFFSGGSGMTIGLLAESGNCSPQFTGDPQLQPAAANGGATATHALGDGSIAIDAADPEFCLPSDQRGLPRPQGAGCDLGAFEVFASFVFGDGFEALPGEVVSN